MADIGFSPTFTCISFSFTTHKCTLNSKFNNSPMFLLLSKHRRSTNFIHCNSWKNARQSSNFRQNGIQAQVQAQALVNQETQVVESVLDEREFVVVGYICNVHGLRGELRVHPSTDFPEERFVKPGARWLKIQRAGVVTIKEFELIGGRSHSGQRQWLIRLKGINSVDEAKELVGAALLVKDADRPILAEDEFYTRDLIGMSVFLKETGELVGNVVDILSSGSSDLLRVMLSASKSGHNEMSASVLEAERSGPLIWIPFAKEIVPDVDVQKGQLQIKPPKGLLELNLCPEGLSNKEKRQQEWKQRRKAQQKVSAIKKKLYAMRQEHILAGLSIGDKVQKHALLDQILSINFKRFQHALQDSSKAYERTDLARFINAKLTRKWWQSLESLRNEPLQFGKDKSMDDDTMQLQREGLQLIAQGQVAVVLLMDEENSWERVGTNKLIGDQSISALQNLFQFQAEQLLRIQNLANSGSAEKFSVPLIVVTAENTVQSLQLHFENQDFFGLEKEQVWFLAQDSLPCVSCSSEEGAGNKILMASPWKIIRSPTGPGGIFSSLEEQNMLERLNGRGIKYVQICTLNELYVIADPIFFGFLHHQEAHIGVKLLAGNFHSDHERHVNVNHIEIEPHGMSNQSGKNANGSEATLEDFSHSQFFRTGFYKGSACHDLIVSMKYLEKLTKKLYEFEYYMEKQQIAYIKEENEKLVEVYPESPNAYELRCSIYSSLKFSPLDKVAFFMYH